MKITESHKELELEWLVIIDSDSSFVTKISRVTEHVLTQFLPASVQTNHINVTVSAAAGDLDLSISVDSDEDEVERPGEARNSSTFPRGRSSSSSSRTPFLLRV